MMNSATHDSWAGLRHLVARGDGLSPQRGTGRSELIDYMSLHL